VAVIAWFLSQYPGLRVHIVNTAIGATGSEFAVFRIEAKLVSKNCDLVFVTTQMITRSVQHFYEFCA